MREQTQLDLFEKTGFRAREKEETWLQYLVWDKSSHMLRIHRARVLQSYVDRHTGEQRVVAVHRQHGKATIFKPDASHPGFWVTLTDVQLMNHG